MFNGTQKIAIFFKIIIISIDARITLFFFKKKISEKKLCVLWNIERLQKIIEYNQKNPMYIEILNALIKSKTSECMRECIRDITF